MYSREGIQRQNHQRRTKNILHRHESLKIVPECCEKNRLTQFVKVSYENSEGQTVENVCNGSLNLLLAGILI